MLLLFLTAHKLVKLEVATLFHSPVCLKFVLKLNKLMEMLKRDLNFPEANLLPIFSLRLHTFFVVQLA
jgi:hypothetical protein